MPYRHAHWWVLALAPMILVAFWPTYFAPRAPTTPALHLHAAAASLWLLLLFAQGWSAANRRLALHRLAGRGVFVVAPLFAAAGVVALVDGGRRFAAGATPFHIANVPPLTLCDFVAVTTFVALVTIAVAERRRVRRHAAALLATPVLVLPPILGRFLQHMPGYPRDGAFGLSGFALSFHLGQLTAIALGLILWARHRRDASGFLIAALSSALQMVLFATLGQGTAWREIVRSFAATPFVIVAIPTALLTLTALALAWTRGRSRARVVPLAV